MAAARFMAVLIVADDIEGGKKERNKRNTIMQSVESCFVDTRFKLSCSFGQVSVHLHLCVVVRCA